jgi:hypothetical protein
MVEVKVGATLYTLLLTTVIFLSSFVLIVQLIPPDAYRPFKTYAGSYRPEDFETGQINLFSFYQNITLVYGASTQKVWFNETEVHFQWYDDYFSSETNASVFSISHFEWDWWVIPKSHGFKSTDGDDFEYRFSTTGREINLFTDKWILRHYDNRTDQAIGSMTCGHISLTLTWNSEDSSYTLPEALKNHANLKIVANWEYDFSKMGSNIWTLLGAVLIFQSIVTGITLLDVILNCLIAIPVWTSIVYILYRIVTGLIPTLSGGSGA